MLPYNFVVEERKKKRKEAQKKQTERNRKLYAERMKKKGRFDFRNL